MQAFIPYFTTIGRILISAIFLLSGISKTSAFEANPSTVAGFSFCGSCKFDDEFGC